MVIAIVILKAARSRSTQAAAATAALVACERTRLDSFQSFVIFYLNPTLGQYQQPLRQAGIEETGVIYRYVPMIEDMLKLIVYKDDDALRCTKRSVTIQEERR